MIRITDEILECCQNCSDFELSVEELTSRYVNSSIENRIVTVRCAHLCGRKCNKNNNVRQK